MVQHTLYPAAYVLRLEGNADPTTRDVLATAFSLAANWSLPLIVDLSALDFGDEELLGHLIYAHQTSGLTLIGPISDLFQRRLDTTGLATLLTIRPTLTAALNH
ncbi:STAS domain-containing protein [Streptomyces cyaneofuscatus]|uniref:anti-sigma factor antagonist n=1 Tax=Streptomyces sp. 021-4 TaxID=2789260 RepID=UPI0039F466D1